MMMNALRPLLRAAAVGLAVTLPEASITTLFQ
jgi:hypothetical protein